MATLVAFTGFEYGTAAGVGTGPTGARVWDGITGTAGTDVKVVSGTPTGGAGDYIGEVNLTAKNFFWDTNTFGAGNTVIVASMYFRLTTLPSGDTDIISMDRANSTDAAGFFYKQSTGKLHAWIGANNQASSATISQNTWYKLQWRYDCLNATNTLDWSLDAVAGTQVTGGSASTIARIAFGNRSAGSGTAQYDVPAVSVTSGDHPLPVYKVPSALKVDPAGTVTTNSSTNFRRFTNNGTIDGAWNATDVRDAIDELPPTIGSTADGAVQISNNTSGYMEIPMTTYTLSGGETIAGVRMAACGWAADTTPATIGFRSWNGSTETTLYAAADPGFDASTTAPGWVGKLLTLADVNTQSELDALAFRVGFSDDAAPDVGIHAIYAEVAVETSGASTVTGTAAAAFTFTGAGGGQRTVTGTAAASLSFSTAETGQRTVLGQVVAAEVFTAAGVGQRTVKGQTLAAPVFTAGASGRRSVFGAGQAALMFTAAAVAPLAVVPGVLTSAAVTANLTANPGSVAALEAP